MNADVTEWLEYVHEHAITDSLPAIVNIAVPTTTDDNKTTWKSRCFKLDDLDAAGNSASKASGGALNVYYRVHLLDAEVEPFKRGAGVLTRWVTHIASDVDIAGPGHKPPPDKILPTFEQAIQLIDNTLPPSAIIASGGGLYAIWRLAEPFEIVGDADRERFKNIGRRLDTALASHGFHVDATALDLARVIRPPGVDNYKPGRDVRPVTVLRCATDGAGDVTLEQLEELLPELPTKSIKVKPVHVGPTDGRQACEIFMDRYDVNDILAVDPAREWEDVGTRDGMDAWRYVGSASSYSIKQSDTTKAIIIWSGTIAAAVDIEPGSALDLWGFACKLAGLDPTRASRGDAVTGGGGRLVEMIEGCALESLELWKTARDEQTDLLFNGEAVADLPAVQLTDDEQIAGELEGAGQVLGGPDGYRYTDQGNAYRLIARHRDHVRFVPMWGRWLRYADGRWNLDHADTLVSHLAAQIGHQLITSANINKVRHDPNKLKALIQWGKRSENKGGVVGTLAAASTVPGIAIDHEALDSDPWLFNVTNGTIDLRTGTLRPSNPSDLLMMQAAVAYEPHAHAVDFETFLERIIPDIEVRSFIQRVMGLALVGEQLDHILPIAVGNGAGGKSTLTKIVATVFGDYAVVCSKDILLALKHDTHPTTKASLFRRRFAHSGELPQGAALDEAQIKELTGGDRIGARRMREDEWHFDPSHTLWLHANHRPTITGVDDGIWRRVLLIPFEVQIPVDERDPKLANRIIANEAPGVLRWMLDGLAAYQADGLAPPAKVQAATAAYRHESNTVEQFFDDCNLELDAASYTPANDLLAAHNEWFKSAAVPHDMREAAHYQEVCKELKRLGVTDGRSRSKGGRYWQGVVLRDS